MSIKKNIIDIFLLILVISSCAQTQTWKTQIVNPGSIAGPKSIVYDDNNQPIIIYAAAAGRPTYLMYARYNGSTWITRTVKSYTDPWGNSSQLQNICVTRKDTLLHCVLRELVGNTPHWFHESIGLDGSIKSSFSLSSSYVNTSLCVGPEGYLTLAAVLVNGVGLTVRRFNLLTSFWSSDSLVDGNISLASSDVTVDQLGNTWIAYKDNVGQNLKVARSKPGGWDIWYVDTPGNVGDYPQIKVDDSGVAHLTYYDATNQKLKYAIFNP